MLKYDSWRQELADLSLGNDEYAVFNKRIVNTSKTVIGVRVPDLRKLAKRLAKTYGDAADFRQFLRGVDNGIFEEVMLAGLMLNEIKITIAKHTALTKEYLKLVDSWAEIDIFVVKNKRFAQPEYWNLAREMVTNPKEFYARYGVILFMSNFLDNAHINDVFANLRAVKNDAYYVKMAMAWLYAEAAVNYYNKTMAELALPKINAWTRRKAYQKMCESYRITDEKKAEIRRLKAQVQEKVHD